MGKDVFKTTDDMINAFQSATDKKYYSKVLNSNVRNITNPSFYKQIETMKKYWK